MWRTTTMIELTQRQTAKIFLTFERFLVSAWIATSHVLHHRVCTHSRGARCFCVCGRTRSGTLCWGWPSPKSSPSLLKKAAIASACVSLTVSSGKHSSSYRALACKDAQRAVGACVPDVDFCVLVSLSVTENPMPWQWLGTRLNNQPPTGPWQLKKLKKLDILTVRYVFLKV